jgi:hypothetical protein
MYIILDDDGVYQGVHLKLKSAILTAIDLSEGDVYEVFKLPDDGNPIYNTYSKRVIRNRRSWHRFNAIDHVKRILENMNSFDGLRREYERKSCQELIDKWGITSKELV